MSPKSDGTDKLLILRGFACFMVFFSHSVPPVISILGFDYSFIFFQDGSSAVKIFFILSGYLIAKNFFNGKYTLSFSGLVKFYKSRITRILPVYYFASLFLLLTYYQNLFFSREGLLKILSVFTFGFDIDQKPYFSGAYWTLSVEMQFYLIVPILIYILSKVFDIYSKTIHWRVIFYIFLAGIIIRLFKQYYVNVLELSQIKMFLSSMYYFTLGIITNLLVVYFKKYFNKLKFSNLIFYSSFFLVSIFLSINIYLQVRIGQILIPKGAWLSLLISSASVFWICLAEINSVRRTEIHWSYFLTKPSHFLEAFGLVSFSFYLWHGDVLWNVRKVIGDNTLVSYVVSILLSFTLTIAISVTSYYLIEKQLLFKFFKNSFKHT